MIVLTEKEAEAVRGRSPKDTGAVLDLVPLRDGRYMLGEQVLDDPAHEDVREFLASLPREPLDKLPLFAAEDVKPEPVEVAALSVRDQSSSMKGVSADVAIRKR